MSMSNETELLRYKNEVIRDILHENDLYKIVGAARTASPAELRRCYLEKSQIVHPDKYPSHPDSTSAFQRLGFAFDILKSPSNRRQYDRTSRPTSSHLPDKTTFLGGEHTFGSAVAAILHEFMTGDFQIVRQWLDSMHNQYPNLVSEETVLTVERSFVRIRELVLTTRTYALLIYIELGRIRRVQQRLMGLGYLDVLGRTRLTIHLVRVTLAVPMRVDRALKEKEEKAWRAKMAGLEASGMTTSEARIANAGILNERISKVLEFIVGTAGKDESADEAWSTNMGKKTA